MKKVVTAIGIPAFCVLTICAAFISCSSAEYVDAVGFLNLTEEISQPSTIRNTEFIGMTGSRVYLELWREQVFLGSTYTVYWTHVSDLPDEISSALESGINPWSNLVQPDNQPLPADASRR